MSPLLNTGTNACHSTQTNWDVVLKSSSANADEANEALGQLCTQYWHPIYAFLRHRGHSPHDAQDLTQSYFAKLLKRGYIEQADPNKGRFRSFLLKDLQFFLSDRFRYDRAQKRGGNVSFISIDVELAESCLEPESAYLATLDLEAYFDRQWALQMVRNVWASVEQEFSGRKRNQLVILRPFLEKPLTSDDQRRAADELGISLGAVKIAVHRLRATFSELLTNQILQTVGADDFESERHHLFQALIHAEVKENEVSEVGHNSN